MNLAEHIAAHRLRLIEETVSRSVSVMSWSCDCGAEDSTRNLGTGGAVAAHAEHVAETWAEHRTITTLDQLRELPEGTVLWEEGGSLWQSEGMNWSLARSDFRCGPEGVALPARIIFHPEEDQ